MVLEDEFPAIGITAAQLNLAPMPTKDAQTLFVERLHAVMAEL